MSHTGQRPSDPTQVGVAAATFRDEIFVFGGSQFEDHAILPGPSGPARIYYNDVWKSADGTTWQEMTDDAPWEPRAGAVVVVKDDFMYLLSAELRRTSRVFRARVEREVEQLRMGRRLREA